MATKEQPQVTVRGIPQNQYNDNVAATTQDPGADPNQGGGIEGHFKKHWVLYTLGLGAVTILIILYVNNRNSNASSGTDTYGYGTGNTNGNGSPSDMYGSQLDADYQQMINQENITNSLLQQLLGAGTSGSTTGGTSGSGSSSGSSGGHKKPPKKGGKGGSSGSSSGNHKKSTSGGTGSKVGVHSGSKSPSSHSTGTSHSNGKTSIKPNPHAGGAHGYVYTTKKGDTLTTLQGKFFPTSNGSNKQGNIMQYGNNSKLISQYRKSGAINSKGQIRPGTKLNA